MSFLKQEVTKFIFLMGLLLLSGQIVSGQEQQCGGEVSLKEMLTKFRFTSRREKTAEQINEELIGEVRRRKVNFALNAADEKSLREAGATDRLIETVRENYPEKLNKAYRLFTRYNEIVSTEAWSQNSGEIKELLEIAKEYVAVFENDACYKRQVDYFKDFIPVLEKDIEKISNLDQIKSENKLRNELLSKLEKAYAAKNWDALFAAGAQILDSDPEFLDLTLFLASAGFDEARTGGAKSRFNDETVRYAERAVKLLEAGRESENKTFGTLGYKYKTEKYPDARANALGWMNYIIGYIKFYRLNQKNESLPYLFKSINYKSETKTFPATYLIFTGLIYERVADLDEEKMRLKSQNAERDVSDLDARIDALLEKAIDYAARAVDAARANPAFGKERTGEIYKSLQEFIKMRYGKNFPFDVEKLISSIVAKPPPELGPDEFLIR